MTLTSPPLVLLSHYDRSANDALLFDLFRGTFVGVRSSLRS